MLKLAFPGIRVKFSLDAVIIAHASKLKEIQCSGLIASIARNLRAIITADKPTAKLHADLVKFYSILDQVFPEYSQYLFRSWIERYPLEAWTRYKNANQMTNSMCPPPLPPPLAILAQTYHFSLLVLICYVFFFLHTDYLAIVEYSKRVTSLCSAGNVGALIAYLYEIDKVETPVMSSFSANAGSQNLPTTPSLPAPTLYADALAAPITTSTVTTSAAVFAPVQATTVAVDVSAADIAVSTSASAAITANTTVSGVVTTTTTTSTSSTVPTNAIASTTTNPAKSVTATITRIDCSPSTEKSATSEDSSDSDYQGVSSGYNTYYSSSDESTNKRKSEGANTKRQRLSKRQRETMESSDSDTEDDTIIHFSDKARKLCGCKMALCNVACSTKKCKKCCLASGDRCALTAHNVINLGYLKPSAPSSATKAPILDFAAGPFINPTANVNTTLAVTGTVSIPITTNTNTTIDSSISDYSAARARTTSAYHVYNPVINNCNNGHTIHVFNKSSNFSNSDTNIAKAAVPVAVAQIPEAVLASKVDTAIEKMQPLYITTKTQERPEHVYPIQWEAKKRFFALSDRTVPSSRKLFSLQEIVQLETEMRSF